MEQLHRIVYISQPTRALAEGEVRRILTAARQNNASNNVTGFLAFTSGCFLQALEGPRGALNRTYAHILRDPRHQDAILVSYQPLDQRSFADWSMGYTAVDSLDRACVQRYSSTGRMDAASLSPAGALMLLQELALATERRTSSLRRGIAHDAPLHPA